MTHRGPDEEGYYHDDIISLGQRRLSIIDLANGTQPISNEAETLHLICNGEIYNSPELRGELIRSGHKFKTATDVEVILHLYERPWGKLRQTCERNVRFRPVGSNWAKLFLGRDHMGQKPLFYYHGPNGFAFASEVKGILASGLLEPQIRPGWTLALYVIAVYSGAAFSFQASTQNPCRHVASVRKQQCKT